MGGSILRTFVFVLLAVIGVWAGQAPQPAQPAPAQPAQSAQPAQPAQPAVRRPPQGGTGPIRVMFATKAHSYDREALASTLDAMGTEISWSHVEHPAVPVFYDPKHAEMFDVFLFYDSIGRTKITKPDGSSEYGDPGPAAKKNLQALMQAGTKGMVFFHHAISSWNRTWPEYSEMMGGACDWGSVPITFKGKEYPGSGAQGGIKQKITVVDKTHPITQGLGDGFEITDETYLCPYAPESVHPLLLTDFKAIDVNFPGRYAKGWRHPEVAGSNLSGWVKVAGRTPIAYIQHGHDKSAFENPAFQTLILNAIKWAASKDAKTWAAANAKTGTPAAWRPSGTN